MAWQGWTGIGGSGTVTSTTDTTFNGAGAPGTNKRYKISGFELDWNNNGAYIYSSNPATATFTLKIVCGNQSVTVGTYSRNSNGARPTISWSGTLMGQPGYAVRLVMTNDGTARDYQGIKNWFQVRINVDTLTRPTVAAGDKITKAQMDALRTWKGGSGTAVTQYAVATAAHGNTYKSGLTAGATVFDDTWYNSVT